MANNSEVPARQPTPRTAHWSHEDVLKLLDWAGRNAHRAGEGYVFKESIMNEAAAELNAGGTFTGLPKTGKKCIDKWQAVRT